VNGRLNSEIRNSKFEIRNSLFFSLAILLFATTVTQAEDGYRLWLRYDPLPKQTIEAYRSHITSVIVPRGSATLEAISEELVKGCSGLLAASVPSASDIDRDGAVVVGNTEDFALNLPAQVGPPACRAWPGGDSASAH
jgi:hypothetical protein